MNLLTHGETKMTTWDDIATPLKELMAAHGLTEFQEHHAPNDGDESDIAHFYYYTNPESCSGYYVAWADSDPYNVAWGGVTLLANKTAREEFYGTDGMDYFVDMMADYYLSETAW